jgi:hypothetical protein
MDGNNFVSRVKQLWGWWRGPTPGVIHLKMLDGGGMQFTVPDPNYVAPRDRVGRALNIAPVKWALAAIGTVIVAVAAIIKSLGLS